MNIHYLSVMKVEIESNLFDCDHFDLQIELTQVSNATVVAYFPPVALLLESSGERPPTTFFFTLVVVGVYLSCYYNCV